MCGFLNTAQKLIPRSERLTILRLNYKNLNLNEIDILLENFHHTKICNGFALLIGDLCIVCLVQNRLTQKMTLKEGIASNVMSNLSDWASLTAKKTFTVLPKESNNE